MRVKKSNEIANDSMNNVEVTINADFRLDKLNDSELLINNLLNKVIGDNLRLNKKKWGLQDIENEIEKVYEFSEQVLSLLEFNVSHLSPHRTSQSKLFIHDNNDVDINSLVKRFVEKKLSDNIVVSEFIHKWMSKNNFDIGEEYRIVTYESAVSKIEVLENEAWINLSDKGFGAGQVFSILLAISLSIDKPKTISSAKGGTPFYESDATIILIEEPEANLHPALQSKLVELFLEASFKFGLRFIIETHSEYMIRKSQLLNLEDKVFKLFYFDTDGPYEMEYSDKGGFSRGFGNGFYDVNDDLALELMLKANN